MAPATHPSFLRLNTRDMREHPVHWGMWRSVLGLRPSNASSNRSHNNPKCFQPFWKSLGTSGLQEDPGSRNAGRRPELLGGAAHSSPHSWGKREKDHFRGTRGRAAVTVEAGRQNPVPRQENIFLKRLDGPRRGGSRVGDPAPHWCSAESGAAVRAPATLVPPRLKSAQRHREPEQPQTPQPAAALDLERRRDCAAGGSISLP